MRPHSPNAYLTSLILHGFVAALIVVSTIYVARTKPVPVIIELVQGPGNDMNALEAPAEGVPEPMKVDIPAVKQPAEPQPQPQVQETPSVPEPPPVTKTVTPKAESVKAPPVPKAKSEVSLARQMKQSQKTSYKEFLKKNPIPKQSAASQVRAAKAPQIDTKGVLGGAKGGSTTATRGSGGKALTREEADQISTYLSFLAQEAKRVYEGPPGVSDQLSVKISFDVTASGAIMNPRIAKSSGNRDFDAAVLDAFRRANSIGPTPDRRPHSWTITFQMKDEA
jgi:TonB family protein